MARRSKASFRGPGCLGLILVIIAGLVWLQVYRNWNGPGPASHATPVVVPQGATLAAAARALEKAGVVRSTTGFLRFAHRFGDGAPFRTAFRFGRSYSRGRI